MKKNEKMFDTSELEVDAWKKLKILYLHRTVDENLIVFTNEKNEFDWVYDYDKTNSVRDELKEHQCITEITVIKSKDLNIRAKEIQKEFRELLADALVNVYYCDYENAKNVIVQAEAFIMMRNREAVRTWSLASTTLTMLLIIGICVKCLLSVDENTHHLIMLMIYSGFGSLGVFLSSFMNLNKKNLQVSVGIFRVSLESVVHVIVGVWLAFLGLLLVKNHILLSVLDNLNFENHEILISIIFSCCESIFPRFIVKVEKQVVDEIL